MLAHPLPVPGGDELPMPRDLNVKSFSAPAGTTELLVENG
jgi:hypothetical protein